MRCSKCIMSEVKGHIFLDEKGICNCCNNAMEYPIINKEEYGFEKLKEIIREAKANQKDSKYDCLVGVSGGKDSLMTLYIAKKELNLNPLAVFIDNGFGLPEMYENIHNAVEKLNVDLVTFRNNDFRTIFKELLLTKKPIYYCRLCHEMIDIYLREIAKNYNINLTLGGYTKGQEYARTAELYWIYEKSDKNTINALINKPEYEKFVDIISDHAMYLYENFDSIVQINPFAYMDYDEQKIIRFLEDELNFKLPKKSWPRTSTNCIFNFVSQFLAMRNFGYSQHESEISTLIRCNEMTRERGLEIIETPITREILEEVLSKLGLHYEDIV